MSTPDYLLLTGRDTSVLLETQDDGAPLWRYWGAAIRRTAATAMTLPALQDERPPASFTLNQPVHFPVFPGFGNGWFNLPAITGHRQQQDFSQHFSTRRIDTDTEANSLTIELQDTVTQLAVTITLALCQRTDVLSVNTSLSNEGTTPFALQSLAAGCLLLPAEGNRLRYVGGRHNAEFAEHEVQLGRHQFSIENRRGITSHEFFPGAVIAEAGTTEHQGLAWGAQLAWSGNHFQTIEQLPDGSRQWHLGEWLAPGEIFLEPGATHTAPTLLATCSQQGFDGVASNFHQAIRETVSWPGNSMAPRQVHANTWEGIYFQHDMADLKALASAYAETGVERFVLDDGWFRNRPDDRSGLGDWTPDATKYPAGLKPLAEHVLELGMSFGLWVEPEMINPDSDLFRAHPDWPLQVQGRPLLTGRNQLVLDMGREVVRNYLFDVIHQLLSTLPVTYLKWDHNRHLTQAGDQFGKPAWHQQVLGTWQLMQRLRDAHPDVEIESCSGGGGRIDAGILKYTHRFWTSDCIDALSRIDIQRGFLQFMPPELMGSHIGTAPAHTTGRSQGLDFRAAVAVTGHLGIEFDVRSLSEQDKAALKSWLNFYKTYRVLLHGSRVWRGRIGTSFSWQLHAEGGEGLLFVYRLQPQTDIYEPLLRIPGLMAEHDYRVRWLNTDFARRTRKPETGFFQQLQGDGLTLPGDWLGQRGLALPPMKAERCAIFHLQRTA
ncbi:MAG: alpha-galactosidase [Pseudomonadales bacterium]|nr:alpha-galactosidase [Pseudomonadales bacterium]